jgi:four helix bundle protein
MEDIKYRAYRFSASMIKFLKDQNWNSRLNVPVFNQLIRSATSIGANVLEGRSENSDREMIKYYRIALKSANESKYWLCLLRDGLNVDNAGLEKLLNEVVEIARIIAASIISMSKKMEKLQ